MPSEPAMPAGPRRAAAQCATVDETTVRTLVRHFYARVRTDPVLGPVFLRDVGPADDHAAWNAHLDRLTAFWSGVMLRTGAYKGNPMAVHQRIEGIAPALFEAWLALFDRAAHEVCTDEVAGRFVARARMIAQSLQLGLFYRHELAARPAPRTGRPAC